MSLIISTSIYRLGDALLLCSSYDNNRPKTVDAAEHEQRVFEHIRKQHLGGSLGRHTSLEGDEASYYILNDGQGVCYVCCAPRGTRRDAVQVFLEDVRRDFREMFSMQQINGATRQYELINFDKCIQKVVRRFDATGGNPQVAALKKELDEVTTVMQQSLEDVLKRGEKLEDLHNESSRLQHESRNYRKKTVHLTRAAMLKKYGPPVAIFSTVFAFIWWKLGLGLLFL